MELAQGGADLTACQVDDGVETGDPGEMAVGMAEGQHVALLDRKGVEPPGDAHHLRRQVYAAHLDAAMVQVAGDLGRAAADVGHQPFAAHRIGIAIQQIAVKGLAIQFVVEDASVFPGDGVVGAFEVNRLSSHGWLLRTYRVTTQTNRMPAFLRTRSMKSASRLGASLQSNSLDITFRSRGNRFPGGAG